LTFYFPQISDGPLPTGILSTKFQFVNLSNSSASVTLTLSQDDGSPWPINAPPISLPPGGAAFWQTGGQSSHLQGGAIIRSDQPIATTAVVISNDSQGNSLGETPAAEIAPQTQSVASGDGIAVFNPSSQPATLLLNLLDPGGNVVSTTQSGPLPPGGHMSGMATDLFGSALPGGSIEVGTGSPLSASVSVAALMATGAQAAASVEQSNASPILITPTLDSSRKASLVIGGAGGTLSVTDANGNIFTLIVPAKALLSPQNIVMTPVIAAGALPAGSLTAGVQLEPDGLALYEPALLKVQLAAPLDSPVAIGWYGSGPGIYLNPVLTADPDLTMVLTHFSGASVAQMTRADVTAVLKDVINAWDLNMSAVGYLAQLAHQTALTGGDASEYLAALIDKIADVYADAIVPLVQLAFQLQDDDLIRCALQHGLQLERQIDLLGANATYDSIGMAINQLLLDATTVLAQHAQQRCMQHDPTASIDLLDVERFAQLLGIPTGLDLTMLNACSPDLELDFTSAMTLSQQSPATSANYSGQISAKVHLISKFGPLPGIADPTSDFKVSFSLSGTTNENYSNVTYNATVTALTGSCTISLASSTPSTLSVLPGGGDNISRIDYVLTPVFEPTVVSDGLTPLCSFCPVVPKTPADIKLYIDPGDPTEYSSSSTSCGSAMSNYWLDVWRTFHGRDPTLTPISGWVLSGSDGSFASNDFMNSLKVTSGQISQSETEKSSLRIINLMINFGRTLSTKTR
jgi:hypothetical protein